MRRGMSFARSRHGDARRSSSSPGYAPGSFFGVTSNYLTVQAKGGGSRGRHREGNGLRKWMGNTLRGETLEQHADC
ncbi:MAG: hypothetical protein MZV70_37170 [Desulfobacterales bacterium]|nr:hypothetical protein [Desulfobacterales bacterium]